MSTRTKTGLKEPIHPDGRLIIAAHKLKIDEIAKELYDIVEEVDFDPNDLRYAKILETKYDQLKELENQLQVYETVMSRSHDYHLGKRESYRFSASLPAFGKRSEIDEHIDKFDSSNRFLIVQGQTGSGKSTQLPQYIADHPRMSGKKIICTQPRKIAAISLAERVSFEYAYGNKKSKVGSHVGYSVGGSKPKIVKKTTRIEYTTEGKMLERLMNRRKEEFKDIGAIIIDEAHERSIVCDILLGTLKKSDSFWNDVLIVVSSATIDLVAFDKYFDHRAKIIEIPGRMYPVERIYKPLPEVQAEEQGEIIKAVAETALEIHCSAETVSGDILCFLPGADEVHRGAVWFENNLKPERKQLTAIVYELYGAQDAEEQRKVFEELDPQVYRKIIFATDIAETSITINGVVYVVDSGVKKEMTYDPKRNISSLKTINISQSSSLQREGRAGRTQPGICYKLYSEEDFQQMNVNTLPEIFRRPLPLAILYLRKMGVDPVNFDWISSPDIKAIKSAEEELVVLGAIEAKNKKPTALGDLISLSQQDPKTVRMIYSGMQKGFGTAAIKIAAVLSVSSLFFYYGGKGADFKTKTKHNEKRKLLQHEDGDIVTMFKLYNQYESVTSAESGTKPSFKEIRKIRSEWILNNSLNGKAIKTAESIVRDLKYIFSHTKLWKRIKSQNEIPNDEDILRLFCSGYFLHAARRVNIKGKGQNRVNYFAIEPEVIGSIRHFKGDVDNGSNAISEWILFDQILRFSEITVFPSNSRVDFDWIQNENEDFYSKCSAKQTKLPTEVLEIRASDTILKTVFGKRMVNLARLEEELHCSIIADLFAGLLRALCSSIILPDVERTLKAEVERAKRIVSNETVEPTWLCNTRLVVGPGYEVTSVLLRREFNILYLRNLDRNSTSASLEDFIYFKINNPNKISSIQLIPQERSCMGIVKLIKSSDAAWLYNELQREFNETGSDVSVAPHLGDASTGSTPRAEDVKLKISWPIGPSTGEATIVVESWLDGNQVVDKLPLYFIGARANAIGDVNLTDFTCKRPQVYKAPRQPFKFYEYANYEVQPIFKVKVKGLSPAVDEFLIIKELKKLSITPLRVFIERQKNTNYWPFSALAEEKEAKLQPFRSIFPASDDDVRVTDFFHKANGRAGILVYHPDTAKIEKVFSTLQKEYLKMVAYGQPYRVELDRLFTFSVHMDLYECFKSKFKKALTEVRNWGVWACEIGPGTGNKKYQATGSKSKFVHIKLRHSDSALMRRCRRTLEEIMQRDSLDPKSSPNVGNLFTWTGRLLTKEHLPASRNYYIHWDYRNLQVHIYGKDPETRREVVETLDYFILSIEKWKQAGFFEVVLTLDRRELENIRKKHPGFIDDLCHNFRFVKGQYHLIGRNKLVISTDSSGEFQKFQRTLEGRGLNMLESNKKTFVARDCGICFCEVDSEFMVTSICNHAFCMMCIQNMFASAAEGAGIQKMPLCCPADKCELRLPIQDIMKAVPPKAIPKLNETALDIYIQKDNGSGLKFCLKPGCNQIFRPNKKENGIPTFYFCDNCLSDFCLDCSEFLKKEIRAHEGLNCEDVRLSEDDKLWKYMNHIRDEILTLHCPKCKTPFYDYDGCAALSCSTCRAAFCALCLKDCGSDAHSHVRSCPYNKSGNLYVHDTSVKEANRLYRINKLKQFFRDSPDFRSSSAPDLKPQVPSAPAPNFKSKFLTAMRQLFRIRSESPVIPVPELEKTTSVPNKEETLDLKTKVLTALKRDLSDLNIKVSDI